jgi:hypothetical protein
VTSSGAPLFPFPFSLLLLSPSFFPMHLVPYSAFYQRTDDKFFTRLHFHLEGSGARRERHVSKFTTELRAGFTTFVTMVFV